MPQQTTLVSLPAELRDPVYEYIALSYATRRVNAAYNESLKTWEYKTTTSAITATCHLIHGEYEDVARKTTTALEFTVSEVDFSPIIDYFHQRVDAKFLSYLQPNKATIRVNLAIHTQVSNLFESMEAFYTWAMFLIGIKLEATYHSDPYTWIDVFEATPNANLPALCVVENNTAQVVRDNIEEVRNVAEAFDRALWTAYHDPDFRKELQARRHRGAERRLTERVESDSGESSEDR